jgi:hypothetical protein
MSEKLIYIYCITGEIPKFDSISKENVHGVSYIFHKGLFAVVSEVLAEEFGEDMLKKNLNDITWLESKVKTHEKIIEKVMGQTTVIPFRFATIFKTEDSLKTMIEKFLDGFRDILNRLLGQEEWGVKIYCDMEKFKATVVKENSQILKMEEEIKSSGIGKAYFLNKKKEELINDIANKTITGYRIEIREALQEQSSAACPMMLLPKEITGRKDEMVMNAAFLVDKTKLNDFIESIKYLKVKYEDAGLDFDYTGPWPPYNFCQVNSNQQSVVSQKLKADG